MAQGACCLRTSPPASGRTPVNDNMINNTNDNYININNTNNNNTNISSSTTTTTNDNTMDNDTTTITTNNDSHIYINKHRRQPRADAGWARRAVDELQTLYHIISYHSILYYVIVYYTI